MAADRTPNDLADRLQAELDEYPTFMDLMEMQERLGPLADFLDALGFDHDAELVRRMLFPSGTVADLRATVREQAEQLDTLRNERVERIVLPPGHTVEDRLAAIRSTPNGALVNIGKPNDRGGGWFRQYRRVDSRRHGVSQLGYFRDGDTADQDIRMTRPDEPWAIEVTHLPVDALAAPGGGVPEEGA